VLKSLNRLIALFLLASGAAPGVALAIYHYDNELARAAVPDETPRQRYQSAIREAGGGLKVGLADCRTLPKVERRPCEAQARSRYQEDMRDAKRMLHDPQARPVNEAGGPVRATETPIRP